MKYGTSQDSLTENSDSTYSGGDTTISNKTYSIKLSNLKENTTYYVQVVATNTEKKKIMTSVESFTTLPHLEMESGMSYRVSKQCYRYLLGCLHSHTDRCVYTCKRKQFTPALNLAVIAV